MDCDSNDSNSHPTCFNIVKFPQFSFSMHALPKYGDIPEQTGNNLSQVVQKQPTSGC